MVATYTPSQKVLLYIVGSKSGMDLMESGVVVSDVNGQINILKKNRFWKKVPDSSSEIERMAKATKIIEVNPPYNPEDVKVLDSRYSREAEKVENILKQYNLISK